MHSNNFTYVETVTYFTTNPDILDQMDSNVGLMEVSQDDIKALLTS